jgi:hypothetical protein
MRLGYRLATNEAATATCLEAAHAIAQTEANGLI